MRGLSQQRRRRGSESRTKRRVQSLHFGWVKKKPKRKARLNLTYAQEIRKYLSLKLILAPEIMLKNRKNVPYFGK